MRPHGPGLISIRVPALSPLPGLEGGWGTFLSAELREHITAREAVQAEMHPATVGGLGLTLSSKVFRGPASPRMVVVDRMVHRELS